LSKRLCKICKIKPPYFNVQWLIGPSSIYVAEQQRTKWNHKKNILTFQWLCLILYLYKQFLRLGQNLPLSYSLLLNFLEIFANIEIFWKFWTLIFLFFFIDFRIWKFYEIFERVVSLLRHAMGCLPGNNRVVTR
jgi:hypothetical protein